MAYLVIVSSIEKGFWSNDLGWVYDLESATHFLLDSFPDGCLMVGNGHAVLKISSNEIVFEE